MRPVRTLLFSTLYPSAARPGHGIFVETRLRELLKTGEVQTRVVAPVPWFPSSNPSFGTRASMARTARREQRNGIDVRHPRYPVVPKVGMSLAPMLLALAAKPALRAVVDEGFDFDLIDAHYYYPDGVAAALLARWFKRPLVITARGSDINLISTYPLPRRMMQWAGRQAGASIGVSGALVDAMRQNLGVSVERLHKLRNGVDLERFSPQDPAAARARLGVRGGPMLLSVGNLVPLKGHDLCIEALALLRADHPGIRLVIIGEGPELPRLREHALALDVGDRVQFQGAVANTELTPWYSAADVLMLASSREGWPNVLLEAMACGTPVVASAVGGVPEILGTQSNHGLVRPRSGQAFADAVRLVLKSGASRADMRRHAERFGWNATSQGQLSLFRGLVDSEAARA